MIYNVMTTIEHNGRKYEYDADFDIFRPVPEPQEQTHMAQFGWLYLCILAVAFSYYMAQ
jgi:hypothetical protein